MYDQMNLRPEHVDFITLWFPIRDTVNKILCLSYVSKHEWGDRFHDIYKLCIAHPVSHSDRIYTETKQVLEAHVKQVYASICEAQEVSINLLNVYCERWSIYQQAIEYLSTLYIYLNTQYVRKFRYSNVDSASSDVVVMGGNRKPQEQLMEINELGAYLWKIEVVLLLKDDLVNLLLNAINDDRMGTPQNQATIQAVINSFIFVEKFGQRTKPLLYQNMFEIPFLHATELYYSNEAKLLLQKNNCSSYLEKVLNILNVEKERLLKFIPSDSHQKVIEVCEKCMVGDYLDFFQNECRVMVKNEVNQDLRNMYLLLKPIDSGLKIMVEQLELNIQERGVDVIKSLDSKDESYIQNFIEKILKVYYHYLNMIDNIFDSEKAFISALDRACTAIINYRENPKQPCKSPEVLSRYCDTLMKRGPKLYNEKEMEKKISEAIIIFKYISDKDIFQKCYSKMLAKRLIHSPCISMENEEAMIQKIKSVCGYEFTSKLQRMFTDIKVCGDFMNEFQAYLDNKKIKLPVTFSAYILQACAWPFTQSSVVNFNLPFMFEKPLTEFESFYSNKFPKFRKLSWIYNISTGEVRFLYTKKPYTVIMNAVQIGILVLFETADELSYDEIKKQTGIIEDQIPRHIQSFLDMKILLIKNDDKSSQSDKVSVTAPIADISISNTTSQSAKSNNDSFCGYTRFQLNLNFSSKRLKFKVPIPPQKDVQQTIDSVQVACVEEDRKMFLQAAIVRIMKTRKKLRLQGLIEEVLNQSKNRFVPTIPMIKKAIESLIEKQYIDKFQDTDEYHYMA